MGKEIATVIMDESAWPLWLTYIETRSETAALQDMLDYHKAHVEKANLVEVDGFGGGLYLTDIPDAGLTLLEIRIGDKSSLGLYSQTEAREIAVIVMNALGLQSDNETLH